MSAHTRNSLWCQEISVLNSSLNTTTGIREKTTQNSVKIKNKAQRCREESLRIFTDTVCVRKDLPGTTYTVICSQKCLKHTLDTLCYLASKSKWNYY